MRVYPLNLVYMYMYIHVLMIATMYFTCTTQFDVCTHACTCTCKHVRLGGRETREKTYMLYRRGRERGGQGEREGERE